MSKKIDESPKAPLSERFRAWWFRGVDEGPSGMELSHAMRSHLEGMAQHAGDIQRAAVRDGARIRGGALESATKLVSYVEYLETALVRSETEYGKVLQAVRAELVDLRAHLEREVTAAKAAEETQNQPPPTALQGEGIAAAA